MALYEFSRRPASSPPKRWSSWWEYAFAQSRGLYLYEALTHLVKVGPWVVDDSTGDKAVAFFKNYPGWAHPFDGFGTPLTVKRLSPMEELEALQSLDLNLRDSLNQAATCPLEIPIARRRMAEQAFRTLITGTR